eukprot:s118_g19.t1
MQSKSKVTAEPKIPVETVPDDPEDEARKTGDDQWNRQCQSWVAGCAAKEEGEDRDLGEGRVQTDKILQGATNYTNYASFRSYAMARIPVGTAGPQRRAPDPSGQRRTSTASSRSQWAPPDLNRELQIPVGTAGPQPRAPDPSGHCRTSTASSRSQWALPDLNGELQIPVCTAGPQGQIECQIEC